MSFTYDEILSQPDTWAETLVTVPGQWDGIANRVAVAPTTLALFVGCGTSYYLAQTSAQVFQEITGTPSRAIPGSEVFLSPASTVPAGRPLVAFVFSRSGTSSEAVLAARHLRSTGATTVVGVTCTPGSDLWHESDAPISLPHANDQSVVMTRSFTNMLLALQVIAARLAGAAGLSAELARIPETARALLPAMGEFARTLGGNPALRRFVYLGLGPNFGLASEATLKLKEMTQTECEPYNPLEFRHGPISIVREDTAVVFLGGERERAYLDDAQANVKRYGARVAAIAPYPCPHADLALALPAGFADVTRAVLYLPAVQLLAHARAELLGLDPDAPRNLGHVVVLDAR